MTKIRTSLNPFLVLHVYYVWHIGKNFIGNTPKDTTLQCCASCWSGAEELAPSNLSGVPTKIAQLERGGPDVEHEVYAHPDLIRKRDAGTFAIGSLTLGVFSV